MEYIAWLCRCDECSLNGNNNQEISAALTSTFDKRTLSKRWRTYFKTVIIFTFPLSWRSSLLCCVVVAFLSASLISGLCFFYSLNITTTINTTMTLWQLHARELALWMLFYEGAFEDYCVCICAFSEWMSSNVVQKVSGNMSWSAHQNMKTTVCLSSRLFKQIWLEIFHLENCFTEDPQAIAPPATDFQKVSLDIITARRSEGVVPGQTSARSLNINYVHMQCEWNRCSQSN